MSKIADIYVRLRMEGKQFEQDLSKAKATFMREANFMASMFEAKMRAALWRIGWEIKNLPLTMQGAISAMNTRVQSGINSMTRGWNRFRASAYWHFTGVRVAWEEVLAHMAVQQKRYSVMGWTAFRHDAQRAWIAVRQLMLGAGVLGFRAFAQYGMRAFAQVVSMARLAGARIRAAMSQAWGAVGGIRGIMGGIGGALAGAGKGALGMLGGLAGAAGGPIGMIGGAGVAALSGLMSAIKSVGSAAANILTAPFRMMGRAIKSVIAGPLAMLASGFAFFQVARGVLTFEDAMAKATAIMDTTEAQLGQMTEAARKMAIELGMSHAEVASSYYEIASAGFSAAETLRMMPVVTRFATAAMIESKKAMELLSDSFKAMKLQTDDAVENAKRMEWVGDVITKASIKSQATVEQLGIALHRSAGSIGLVNMGLEEAIATLSVFADVGRKAEIGGYALRAMVVGLQTAYASHGKVFQRYGIDIYDESTGKFKDMATIVDIFTKQLGKLTPKARAAAFAQMHINRIARESIGLLFGLGDRIRSYQGALNDVGGTTKMIAEKNMGSLLAQLKRFWAMIVDVGIAILGGPLSKGLSSMLQKIIALRDPIVRWIEEVQGRMIPVLKKWGHEILILWRNLGPLRLSLLNVFRVDSTGFFKTLQDWITKTLEWAALLSENWEIAWEIVKNRSAAAWVWVKQNAASALDWILIEMVKFASEAKKILATIGTSIGTSVGEWWIAHREAIRRFNEQPEIKKLGWLATGNFPGTRYARLQAGKERVPGVKTLEEIEKEVTAENKVKGGGGISAALRHPELFQQADALDKALKPWIDKLIGKRARTEEAMSRKEMFDEWFDLLKVGLPMPRTWKTPKPGATGTEEGLEKKTKKGRGGAFVGLAEFWKSTQEALLEEDTLDRIEENTGRAADKLDEIGAAMPAGFGKPAFNAPEGAGLFDPEF